MSIKKEPVIHTPLYIFSLTYGALVAQILKDYESVDDVNKQLEKMGHNIGVRLVEDFLSRTNSQKCSDFRDVSDKIQLGFKMFLNIRLVFQNKMFKISPIFKLELL